MSQRCQTRKKSGSVSGTHSKFSQFGSKIFAAVTVVTYQSSGSGGGSAMATDREIMPFVFVRSPRTAPSARRLA